MYRCRLDSKGPLVSDPELHDVGGAYLVPWIASPDYDGACVLADYYVARQGWLIDDCWEELDVSAGTVDEEDRPFFDEASEFGYCASAYRWSKDAPDADQNYEKLRDVRDRQTDI